MINDMRHAMMKTRSKIVHYAKLSSSFTLLLFFSTASAAELIPTLSIQVSGFGHNRGHVIANLFREGDDVLKPDKAYRRAQAEIRDGLASIDISDLAYGKYAVSVFHDENDNGTLDHNFFRFPAEPLGFSNHFHFGLFSGLPSFEKMQFQFTADTHAVEITVK